jgi:cytochrome c oxidase cbb3-type subunit I/II
MSALMAVPVVTFAVNILLTMRGAKRRPVPDKAFWFMMAGFWGYIVTSLQGSFQAFRTINQFVHFSQWPVAHAHLALTLGMGFLVVGIAFTVLPEVSGRRLWSRKLLDTTWWIAILGFATFFSAMTVAGLVQNSSWAIQVQIVPTLPMLPVHFLARAIGGGMVVVSAYLFAINLGMTLVRGGAPETADAQAAALPVPAAHTGSRFQKGSQERLSLTVIVVGALALFGLMTFMVVGMGAMFGGSEPTDRAHELTEAELRGQALYRANGCFYCHSQFVRTSDWAVGVPSEAGDFYYSSPNFLGTERTGPTLGQIGGMRPTLWLHDHYVDPRMVEPRSIMPSFAWLGDDEIADLDAYVQHLGGKDLETRHFQPRTPAPYDTVEDPNAALVERVSAAYDPEQQAYSGDASDGDAYATLFETAKVLHVQRCLSCHGCSGNSQGPYARTLVVRPANIVERVDNYPDVTFHFWRVSEGVPGTSMPPWRLSLTEEERWASVLYERSLANGALRTVDGGISDDAAKAYAASSGAMPAIAGTAAQWDEGQRLYDLYCAQCHGTQGEGDGPASSTVPGGYINPQPAVFPETGHDFEAYGQYLWKVREGVPTTHMPPWKYALSEEEISLSIFYVQTLAEPADYAEKWGPLYSDSFARNFKR